MALIYRIFSRAWAYVTGKGILVLLCTRVRVGYRMSVLDGTAQRAGTALYGLEFSLSS